MKIRKYKDGSVKIHIEDADCYEVTEHDNGVDFWPTEEQLSKIREVK